MPSPIVHDLCKISLPDRCLGYCSSHEGDSAWKFQCAKAPGMCIGPNRGKPHAPRIARIIAPVAVRSETSSKPIKATHMQQEQPRPAQNNKETNIVIIQGPSWGPQRAQHNKTKVCCSRLFPVFPVCSQLFPVPESPRLTVNNRESTVKHCE